MFGTLKTLIVGANARAEEQVRDVYAIELIDQKIREASANLKAAKVALAGLIQRERGEQRQIETLEGRIVDLLARAKQALAEGRDDLAQQAAQAIADLENELAGRQQTQARLEARIMQLRQSVETAHRRIIDLKQGAVTARAIRKEQGIQRSMNRHLAGDSPFEEAEALISRVMGGDDPFEQGEILREIDSGLNHGDIAGRMADAGFGDVSKATGASVMDRLKTQSK
ncbi:PspA/IM30 family protein [Shimia sagamensis]|uniref:Phage shock protein A (PspA) family protein n=1 Tax=Shimia sagamensis TaxID=1566352 RepID=A0ABY1P571_9RHOB|nr:PspA/IM30 family protein [Shimia sagamensis]SMP25499.1 phage shock protein A (PspA) family protein [Shimia sagamensis]